MLQYDKSLAQLNKNYKFMQTHMVLKADNKQ